MLAHPSKSTWRGSKTRTSLKRKSLSLLHTSQIYLSRHLCGKGIKRRKEWREKRPTFFYCFSKYWVP
jgi:hypothetical protein